MKCPDCGEPLDKRDVARLLLRCHKCRAKRNCAHLAQPDSIQEPRNNAEEILNDKLKAVRLAEVWVARLEKGSW